jgi:hypothetical protein
VEMQRDSSTFKPGLLLASVVEGTTWKCSGNAVPFPVDFLVTGVSTIVQICIVKLYSDR